MIPFDFYIPDDIPNWIKSFDYKINPSVTMATGKYGSLLLVFKINEIGKTVLEKSFSKVPLYVQRVLYCDDSFHDLANVYIVSVSGGLLQGDRYRIDITMKKNSMAFITTQGATRIYGMNSNCAMQVIDVTLNENSYLEFVPDQIIPYRNSRFYQNVNLNIHASATLVYSEIVTPGRIAMGESFDYDVFFLKTAAFDQGHNLKFIDISNIEPKKQMLKSYGVLGKYSIFGSVYIFTKEQNIDDLYSKINTIISNNEKIFGGVSVMNDSVGLFVRILGCDTEIIKCVILEIVFTVRHLCIVKNGNKS